MNLDRERIARLLALAGSTDAAGEAQNAVRIADHEIRKAGIGWAELIAPNREVAAGNGANPIDPSELATANEANLLLLVENAALREELDLLRNRAGGGQWDDVGESVGNVNAAAQWAIDLTQRGDIDLTEREIDFLDRCRQWRGRLTPRMNDWFVDLVAKVTARTGQYPPA
jgi:hypothetical protein